VPETHPETEATRVAIDAATLWLDPDPEAHDNAVKQIARLTDEAGGSDQLIVGLLDLSIVLVTRLAQERDPDARDVIERARAILRDLSPKLPE
jgi:hypothetical protein